jgi:antitoxin component of MazEF toxin-antitoxin module
LAAFRKFVMKVSRNGNSLTIAIPDSLVTEFGLRKGDHVFLTRVGSSLLITPVENLLEEAASKDMGAVVAAVQENSRL